MKINRFHIIFGSLSILLAFGFISCSNQTAKNSVSFGICTDVHKDLMHDADERLSKFINDMNQKQVDFTIQLGDFCRPYTYNDTFMNIWNSFEGPNYHVLGNHDMDGGFSREETVLYWKMPSKYYSFDNNGFHFVVLDGNDSPESAQEGYARYLGKEQRNWLTRDLSQTDLPCIIFSHQSMEDEWGIENANEVRSILEKENQSVGERKVLACFNGHSHMDTSIQINDIWYVEINSMSYFWVGDDYKHISYSTSIDENYPWIKYTCPYNDPLYALVTINQDGKISIEGQKSNWVGPSPSEVGYNYEKYMDRIRSVISNMTLN